MSQIPAYSTSSAPRTARGITTAKSNSTSFAPTPHSDVNGGTRNSTMGGGPTPLPVRPSLGMPNLGPDGRYSVDISKLRFRPTQHAIDQVRAKGIPGSTIKKCFTDPERVYPSSSHPGQTRITGHGVCLVGRVEGGNFSLITVYEDGVLTPPRPDQLNTPEGRRYAERYAAGLGRG